MDSAASSSYFHSLSLDQVLDDLSSRFIVNLPAEELESIERICFQIEQAHWYYEDFVRPQASHLPSYSLRKFSEIIFQTNPLLSHYDAVSAYDHFMRYKERVPVCGAILLTSSMEKCLVVRGWKSGASWSFPRGKINQGEEERDCAVREVWEETGYDISPHFNSEVLPHHPESHSVPPLLPPGEYADDDYLECVMKEQRIRLYIVPDVPEDTLFETKTRKEISKIAWAPLTSLPTWSKNRKPDKKDLKCYMVTPFVNPLKSWIKTRKNPSKKQQKGRKALPESLEPVAIAEEEDSAVVGSTQDVLPPEPSSAGLLEQSRALQALFFGESEPLEELQPSYEPSTSAAGRLPSPPSHDVSAHSRTLLQSLNNAAAAPLPASPQRNDSLNRLLGIRSVETASSAQSPSTMPGYTTAAQSTIMPTSPRNQVFSSSVTPSYSDYRNSALSPSGFANTRNGPVPPPLVRAPGPSYTEEEREKARNQLLLNLAAQLGTGPTPPSADEDSFEEDEEEEEKEEEDYEQHDNPKADKQSPAVELLQLFQAQLQDDAARGPLQAPRLTKQALNDLQQAQYAQPRQHSAHTPERATTYQLPLHSPQPRANPQSQNAMLNILNGLMPPAASQPPRSPLAQQQSVPQATSPNVSYNSVPHPAWSEQRPQQGQQPAPPFQHTQAGHNGRSSHAAPMTAEGADSRPADINGKPQAAQASALLSLFNAPKTALSPTQSATPTNNANGKADLLRLFANAKV